MTSRTPPLVGSPLFAGNLTSTSVQSSTPALADIPRVIGGNNRLWYEHAKGAALAAGMTKCAPQNSRGLWGEDHSGAPFGAPIWMPYFVCNFSSSDDEGPNNRTIGTSRTVSSDTDSRVATRLYVMVPSCFDGGAFSTSIVSALVETTGGGGTGSTGVLGFYPRHMGGDVGLELTFDTSAAAFSDEAGELALLPGQINEVIVEFNLTAGDCDAYVRAIMIGYWEL